MIQEIRYKQLLAFVFGQLGFYFAVVQYLLGTPRKQNRVSRRLWTEKGPSRQDNSTGNISYILDKV